MSKLALSVFVAGSLAGTAEAGPTSVRCADLPTGELAIDGMLDDWPRGVLARVGAGGDGAIEVRCAWDGAALAIAVDIKDDRVVRLARGQGHEDSVALAIAAGGAPIRITVHPGTSTAKSRITAPPRVAAADSLQRAGFSIEARIPAAAIPGLSQSTPALDASIVFRDADQATGGDTTELALPLAIELGDRKDLLDDFLRTVKLKRSDVRLDTLAELDPDRRGKERIVAGGTVIGVLTDQFAYVALPVARAADLKQVSLLALGPRGQQVVSAVARQTGNGGARELLLLWTVWSGQLHPLAQIEIRKELGANLLEATWRLVPGKRGPELWVEPKPAIGFTAETWAEVPASDADPIVVPWDPARGGVAYTLTGAELARRNLPRKRL